MWWPEVNSLSRIIQDISALDTEILALAIVIVSAFTVLNVINGFAKKKRKESGVGVGNETVSIDGGHSLPVRHYISEMQGLAGKPDAIITENGYIIPVERKPLANKIRDRYIAQLLVYMRLIEEFEGKKPPYGYLILGPSCRKIRIDNTETRQAWLQGFIDDMRKIIDGAPSAPSPHPKKCRKCDVREHCKARGDTIHSNSTLLSKSA